MFNDILWRFMILETFVLGAVCSNRCVKKHRQTWFCTSDLVVTGIYHEVQNPPDTGGYVEIKEVFKGDVRGLNIEDNGYVRFETPTYVNFLDGMKYLISGRNKNGRIYSDMCIKDMELFTKYGYFFKKASKIGCDCMDEIGKYRYDNNVCEWAHSYMKIFGKNCKCEHVVGCSVATIVRLCFPSKFDNCSNSTLAVVTLWLSIVVISVGRRSICTK